MPASPILDVAIGLIFVFLLVALIASQIGDKISSWLRWRSKELENGIRNFIVGKQYTNLFNDFYENPLIKSLVPEDSAGTRVLEKTHMDFLVYKRKTEDNIIIKTASSIPKETFALALFDLLVPNSGGQTTLGQLKASITTLPPNTPMRAPLLSLINTADGKVENFRTNVENWFDNTIYKTTQIYQRNMMIFALVITAAVAVFLNVDAIAIGTELWHDSSLRAALVGAAAQYTQGSPEQDQALQQLNSLNLPIGWNAGIHPSFFAIPNDWLAKPGQQAPSIGLRAYILKALGWLITAMAGAQGAPFWFDFLKKLTNRG